MYDSAGDSGSGSFLSCDRSILNFGTLDFSSNFLPFVAIELPPGPTMDEVSRLPDLKDEDGPGVRGAPLFLK